MTPRPRVVVVAPETTVDALRDLMPAAELVAAGVSELVGHVVRGPVRAVVVTGRPPEGAIDVLRTVRQTRRDISLMLVTDADASDERLRALGAGVDDALPPIPLEELAGRLTLIARIARRRRACSSSSRVHRDGRSRATTSSSASGAAATAATRGPWTSTCAGYETRSSQSHGDPSAS